MKANTQVFLVTLTPEDLKNTLYAIALARVVCVEDIDRYRRTPTEHPLYKAHQQGIAHATGNHEMLNKLWEGYAKVYHQAGFVADSPLSRPRG